jgi:phosphonate transport system permease protein
MNAAVDLLEHQEIRPAVSTRRNRGRAPRRMWLLVVVAALAASAWQIAGGRDELVNPGGWSMVQSFFAAALTPTLEPEFLRITWDATLTTLAYASLGTGLSVLLGLVFGVLVSQTWWGVGGAGSRGSLLRRGGWLTTRGALGLPRGVHEVVWGLFLVNILGLDPLVGVLAIGIPFGAVTAKVFSELIDETPKHGYDGLRSAGAGRFKAFCYALGPQAFPDLLSYSFYRFECAIRAAAILGIIGAGGLGYQLSLSFSSLRYNEMWTLLYALMVVSGLADLWSTLLRRPDRNRRLVVGTASGAPGLRRDWFLNGSLFVFGLLALVSAVHLKLRPANLWSDRAQALLADIIGSSFPPDLGGDRLRVLGELAVETVAMAVLALAVASILGVATAFVAARSLGAESGHRAAGAAAASLAARAVLLFCRAVPPPVWALLLLFVLFAGPLPGALALALYNYGILGRLMAEVVENLDSRPIRALRAQGTTGVKAFFYGVLPLTLPRFSGYSLYRWEVTMREVVVVGLVGAGGLGRLLQEQLSSFDYQGVTATLFTLICLTILADVIGSSARRALR